MDKCQERFQAMKNSWVISDTNHLLWDTNDDLEYQPFPSITSAVRHIQNIEGSAKKSLQTAKMNQNMRIYQCRDSEGNMIEYYIYRICDETMEQLLDHDSEI